MWVERNRSKSIQRVINHEQQGGLSEGEQKERLCFGNAISQARIVGSRSQEKKNNKELRSKNATHSLGLRDARLRI